LTSFFNKKVKYEIRVSFDVKEVLYFFRNFKAMYFL